MWCVHAVHVAWFLNIFGSILSVRSVCVSVVTTFTSICFCAFYVNCFIDHALSNKLMMVMIMMIGLQTASSNSHSHELSHARPLMDKGHSPLECYALYKQAIQCRGVIMQDNDKDRKIRQTRAIDKWQRKKKSVEERKEDALPLGKVFSLNISHRPQMELNCVA